MKTNRGVVAALLLACPVLSGDDTVMRYDPAALMLPVQSIVAAFNARDPKLPETSIVDDAVFQDRYPPFVWSGKGAAAAWYEHLIGRTAADREKRSKLEEHLELGKSLAPIVAGDRAYLVVPCTFTWLRLNTTARQAGFWVITEHRGDGGAWRVTGLSWAAGAEPPKE